MLKVAEIPDLKKEIPRLYGICQLSLGEIAYRRNDLDKAEKCFQNALPIFEKDNYSGKLLKLYKLFQNLYSAKSDNEKSAVYLKLQTKQSGQLDENKRKAIDLTVKKLESERLKFENKSKRKTVIIWSTVTFSILLLIGLYIYLDRKRVKQKQLYQQIISKIELRLNEKNTGTGCKSNDQRKLSY